MNTHSHHPSRNSVGRHPDRPARGLSRPRTGPTEEPPRRSEGGFSSILRRLLAAWGITVLSAALLTAAAAIVLYNTPDPTPWILPASVAAWLAASLCGGLAAGRLSPSSPVAAGLLSGGGVAALILLVSFAFGEGGGLIPWAMGLGALLLHLVGGALARPRKKAPSHRTGGHPSRR